MTSGPVLLRSLFHLSGVIIPALYYVSSRESAIAFTLLILCAVALIEFLRLGRRLEMGAIQQFLKSGELKKPTGSFFYVLGVLAVLLFFSKPVALCSILVLCISDPLSSLAGRFLGRHRLAGKSIEGGLAFFLSSSVILWLFGFGARAVFLTAAVATLTEFFTPAFLDDNFTIPVVTGAMLAVCGA